jgi:hypothetical protein
MHDLLFAKLASPGDRPTVVQHEASRKTIKSLVGAGFGITLLCEACIGAKQICRRGLREARDGNGPTRVGYTADWDEENCNPALAGFLKPLRERYSLLPETN